MTQTSPSTDTGQVPATPARKTRPRPQYRAVQVSRVRQVTPRMVRVTVTGDELGGFSTQGVAGHIRVLLPAPGQAQPVLPVWGPNGPEYAEGVPRPTSRAYTPRRWDPDAMELDIDFVLHGDNGPASAWAARVRPGDKLVVVAPRRAYQPDATADWHMIAADEAAIPGAATVLEVLPSTARAIVYLEVADASDEQPMPSPANVEIHWLHRGNATPGALLEAAIRAMPWPQGTGRVWVACESMAMRAIRRHLLQERGIDRAAINTQGYWKLGAANHPDHDTGEEI